MEGRKGGEREIERDREREGGERECVRERGGDEGLKLKGRCILHHSPLFIPIPIIMISQIVYRREYDGRGGDTLDVEIRYSFR